MNRQPRSGAAGVVHIDRRISVARKAYVDPAFFGLLDFDPSASSSAAEIAR